MKYLSIVLVALFLAACSGSMEPSNSCVPAPVFDAPNWAACNADGGNGGSE